jgi:hypothetical protein
MKNKYIEVIKRWQAGEAITLKELGANAEAAYVAAAEVAAAAEAAWAVARAAETADAACAADPEAYAAAVRRVDYFVKQYELVK